MPGGGYADWWCNHWEPTEGKCCWNCSLSTVIPDGEKEFTSLPENVYRCGIEPRTSEYHWADGCALWRWKG